MNSPTANDLARQAANVAGAVFQVAAAVTVGAEVGAVANANRSLVLPAGYAFAIWTPIFLLSLAYAVYQALPAHRTDPLLRKVGWLTAAAYTGNGLWELLFPNRQFVLAQVVLLAIWGVLAAAYLRVVRSGPRLTAAEAWLVALPVGLTFGWLTAANVAGLAGTGVALGLRGEGMAAAIGGAALLIGGGALAGAAIVIGKRGPAQAWIGYVAAMLWALVAVVVNQWGASTLTAGTAAVVALALLVIAVAAPSVGRWRIPTSGAAATLR